MYLPTNGTLKKKKKDQQRTNLMIFKGFFFMFFFFLNLFLKAYVVGNHLNCIDKSMQFKWIPTPLCLYKEVYSTK